MQAAPISFKIKLAYLSPVAPYEQIAASYSYPAILLALCLLTGRKSILFIVCY